MADASVKVITTTPITHISSGASIAPAAISTDAGTLLVGSTNLNKYPRADVALMVTLTASVASTSTMIYLYRRDMNVDSTNDMTAPGASNKQKYVGAFQIPAATTVSTTHYVDCKDVDLGAPGDCEFYLENALAVNILAGWTLKVTPKTDVGATA